MEVIGGIRGRSGWRRDHVPRDTVLDAAAVMLYNITYINRWKAAMPKGESGRVVIEVEVELKRELYAALARRGLTMKAWFIATAREWMRDRQQGRLEFPPDDATSSGEQQL